MYRLSNTGELSVSATSFNTNSEDKALNKSVYCFPWTTLKSTFLCQYVLKSNTNSFQLLLSLVFCL